MKNALYGTIVGSVMGSFFGLQMGLNTVNVKRFGDVFDLLGKSSTRLTSDFIQYWEENTPYENNEGKLKVMYRMLCVAMDRIIEKSSGEIGFNMTPSKLHSKTLGGVYQKFLA